MFSVPSVEKCRITDQRDTSGGQDLVEVCSRSVKSAALARQNFFDKSNQVGF